MTKTVFVTGADRGLGFSFTKFFLEKQYKVFAGQFIADWDFLSELKEQYPDTLEIVPLDIGDDQSVKKAARQIASKTEHLDMVINNAAIGTRDDHSNILVDLDYENMKTIFNVNTLGSLRVTNSIMGLLLQSEDKLVINISSEAGSVARNHRISGYGYCMSKSALNMQSSIVHEHLKKLGGQVMVFYPGWLQTYMSGQLSTIAPTTPDESALKIIGLIENHKQYMGDEPIFLDMDGQVWPW
ncbi:MAG: SDR family NAD(P)-dependent oxidoreductase [Candidatus Pristimantibacillus lignocellulolyticus]|uniref:SDR family NAD(P)-dependent oxidoreductase n=1 Tax=Candidatus Pristimantibacillus lignocellulolyticus TaxID=2994561 RepID=A0A9J6ZJ56_9BACL|nr:MAG: SDR family NAD(P)-dependent oxidoreductase [Candidatus Pristimantibacillus lignocellulolyticus]